MDCSTVLATLDICKPISPNFLLKSLTSTPSNLLETNKPVISSDAKITDLLADSADSDIALVTSRKSPPSLAISGEASPKTWVISIILSRLRNKDLLTLVASSFRFVSEVITALKKPLSAPNSFLSLLISSNMPAI